MHPKDQMTTTLNRSMEQPRREDRAVLEQTSDALPETSRLIEKSMQSNPELLAVVHRSQPIELSLALGSFLFRFGLWRGCHRRGGIGGCFGGVIWVIHRATLVCANGQLLADVLTVNDDGGFGGGTGHDRLRVRVVGHGWNLPNVAALDVSRSLFLAVAPAVLDLDEAGMCRNLAV
jgi:hypothetical protein